MSVMERNGEGASTALSLLLVKGPADCAFLMAIPWGFAFGGSLAKKSSMDMDSALLAGVVGGAMKVEGASDPDDGPLVGGGGAVTAAPSGLFDLLLLPKPLKKLFFSLVSSGGSVDRNSRKLIWPARFCRSLGR